ncbi:MAG: hypothetical protein ACFB0G_11855 [Leptolyngbyaceae cyanobacterium]
MNQTKFEVRMCGQSCPVQSIRGGEKNDRGAVLKSLRPLLVSLNDRCANAAIAPSHHQGVTPPK